ncbi:MAG: phosphopantothenoylcysteine decarboxylase [Planctomycetota bacterium]|nr:MAG: phosphopantothenoylcysteine decarboxylase [Planctomycetota bacterium]REK25615.1 MAG: phosphopantothenoylcysteine decarboxylase [Planctomycetota bacterium]REK31674.1 MAG: phosphopantothenoylcysteine decarboxylase [Planctomycetota bacterium]
MHVLITAGPTREYLDDVRYLTNASSGKMGYALAQAARDSGWDVTLVTGPVEINPPVGCTVLPVVTTAEMLAAATDAFPNCDGVIAAAAVCDYRPRQRTAGKISKTGGGITLEMIETDDVLAALGAKKEHRWVLGFALEAQNPHENALQKLRRKNCDWIVLNAPSAVGSDDNSVELIDPTGEIQAQWTGSKSAIARDLIAWIGRIRSASA